MVEHGTGSVRLVGRRQLLVDQVAHDVGEVGGQLAEAPGLQDSGRCVDEQDSQWERLPGGIGNGVGTSGAVCLERRVAPVLRTELVSEDEQMRRAIRDGELEIPLVRSRFSCAVGALMKSTSSAKSRDRRSCVVSGQELFCWSSGWPSASEYMNIPLLFLVCEASLCWLALKLPHHRTQHF